MWRARSCTCSSGAWRRVVKGWRAERAIPLHPRDTMPIPRRRIVLLTAAAVMVMPCLSSAQSRTRTIGFLVPGSRSSHGRWVAAFVQRLGEVGWTEGRNVAIDYRWAEGRLDVA